MRTARVGRCVAGKRTQPDGDVVFFFFVCLEAFEELERTLGVAQRADEARKQLQVQLDERVKEVERAGEEERKSLQQELTRVKQEVVTIMKVRNFTEHPFKGII